jgi:DNA-binding MarR family transcriptional regulator
MAVTPTTDPARGAPAETSPPETSPPKTPEEIAGRLRLSATRLARRLRQQADTGLSPSQLSALAVVERHGPLTLGALAEQEQVAPPSITRVVAKLEADGFLTRRPDPTDRRVTRVAVTPKGKHLLVASRRRKTAWLTTRLEGMDADQRARLADALDILDALTTEPR